SVANTAFPGVLAAIQLAAANWSAESTCSRLNAVQALTSRGEGTARAKTIASAGSGQRRISHPASSADAMAIAWKYLFISKPITLTCTTLGIKNRAIAQAPRNQRAGVRGASSAAAASTTGRPRLVTWKKATAAGPSENGADSQPGTR